MHFFKRDDRGRFSVPQVILMVAGGFVLAAVLALVFGWVVMLLWNWLMPAIFKLPAIDYWQAWGLLLLSQILLKPGFGHHGPHGRHFGGHRHGKDWKDRFDGRFGHPGPKPTEENPAI